jgi:hypothetical protein
VLFSAHVCFRIDLEQEKNLAVPNVIHLELKGPVSNTSRAYKDIDLTIGTSQLFLLQMTKKKYAARLGAWYAQLR